jgi:anti-sigma-K factor RskA
MAAADAELHLLAAAYAMHAASTAEQAEFEQHLSRCAPCREDVAGFREAAARMAAAAAVSPKAELRGQVLGAATAVRQLPPLLRRPPGLRSRRLRWITAVAAAAAVVAGILVAATFSGTSRQLAADRHSSHLIAEVLAAPDAVILTAELRTGGTAAVVMSHREHAAVFTARGLAPLPPGRGYELWLMGPGGEHPAGMLSSGADGMAGPAVVAGMRPHQAIALTVERSGGSAKPTSQPLVVLGARH